MTTQKHRRESGPREHQTRPLPAARRCDGSRLPTVARPTALSASHIAGELYVSHNTVRTHITHLYAKLGTHTRAEAVARARALGLLAPSPLRGQATLRGRATPRG